MSKKDYVAVAEKVRCLLHEDRPYTATGRKSYVSGYHKGYEHGIVDLAFRLADLFEADNPRFDRQKFLDATGVFEPRNWTQQGKG